VVTGGWLSTLAHSQKKRVAKISALHPILRRTSVQLRGWDFPHLDDRKTLEFDSDWIGQETKWNQYLEFWRFYQSGQFVVFRAMDEDWRDQSSLSPAPKDWKPGSLLSVEETVRQLAEIFEFAARLSFTEAGDEVMRLRITIAGLQGRSLSVESPRRPLKGKTASIQELPYQIDLSRLQLVAEPRDLSLAPAIEIFQCFSWDPGLEILRDMQENSLRRRSTVTG